VFYERVESLWPVHGSVLFHKDALWFVAGRNMFLDGGMALYRLNPVTGEPLSVTRLTDRETKTDKPIQDYIVWLNMPATTADILSTDGRLVYLKSQPFTDAGTPLPRKKMKGGSKSSRGAPPATQDPKQHHLFCPTGFLDDTGWHRSYWLYGSRFVSGWCGYFKAGLATPSGKILAFDKDTVYGFGREPRYYRWTTPMEFRLFAAPRSDVPQPAKPDAKAQPKPRTGRNRKRRGPGTKYACRWSVRVPILARAMVTTPDHVVVAGPPDVFDDAANAKGGIDLVLADAA
jgi:hypothetical protein